jgi:hypothetical protein
MDYKLVKQLRDAGYPQPQRDMNEPQAKGSYIMDVYDPTLAELIEACGEYVILFNCDGSWYAAIWGGHYFDDYRIDGDLDHSCEGETPEQAVALLWLELQCHGDRATA